MNNRDHKNFQKGNYYHVYNRGNNKNPVFLDEEDFKVFLFFAKEAFYPEFITKKHRRKILAKDSFGLVCYCLMPNHYHFIIEQKTEIPITKVIVKICTSYSKYFNKKYSSVGHLFQDKFKSVLIESNEQLRLVFDYIHNNPKEAGLVNNISDWKWSSYSKVPEFTMSDIVIL